MDKYIKGCCHAMCPSTEVEMRISKNLIHFFELNINSNNRHPEPDPKRMVKEYQRSAAGMRLPQPNELRTENALRKTVDYLIRRIATDNRKPFTIRYDFIFNRFRSVRQEIVIQNFDTVVIIEILVPIIMFLAYSCYRLIEEPIDRFDPVTCRQHLQELIKKVLNCYEQLDFIEKSRKKTVNIESIRYNLKHREIIESLYLLLNLGSKVVLERFYKSIPKFTHGNLLRVSHQTALNYFLGNYYRVFKNIELLPHILCAIATLKLQLIRREAYIRFSIAYQNKVYLVPVTWLQHILLYSSKDAFINDCKYYNIEVIDKKGVRFSKSSFDEVKLVHPPRHEQFVDRKIEDIDLIDLLLLKNI